MARDWFVRRAAASPVPRGSGGGVWVLVAAGARRCRADARFESSDVGCACGPAGPARPAAPDRHTRGAERRADRDGQGRGVVADRKSTRLNSSHDQISYAVFCLKKKIAPRVPIEQGTMIIPASGCDPDVGVAV